MKKQPKWEVNFQDRIKQRDIAKGVRPPDPRQKGFRHKQYKKYFVIPPAHKEFPHAYLDMYYRFAGKILWLKHHEVVERKLMGYTVEPYNDSKHWYLS